MYIPNEIVYKKIVKNQLLFFPDNGSYDSDEREWKNFYSAALL